MESAPIPANTRKIRVLLALKLLLAIQYGVAIKWSFFKLDADWSIQGITEFGYVVLIAGMFVGVFAAIGVWGMRHCLGAINDQIAMEIWSLVALLLAPLMAAVYVYISINLPIKNELFALLCNLASPFIGFYLPFVLMVLWIKYRYRQDEF